MPRFEFAGTVDAENKEQALEYLRDVVEAVPYTSRQDAIGTENVYFKIWKGGEVVGDEQTRQDTAQEKGGEAEPQTAPQTTESPEPDVDVNVDVNREEGQAADESQQANKEE